MNYLDLYIYLNLSKYLQLRDQYVLCIVNTNNFHYYNYFLENYNKKIEFIKKYFNCALVKNIFGSIDKLLNYNLLKLSEKNYTKSFNSSDYPYIDNIDTKNINDKITIGIDKLYRPFIIFRIFTKEKNKIFIDTIFQRFPCDNKRWMNSSSNIYLSFIKCDGYITEVNNKYIVDSIKNIIVNKPVYTKYWFRSSGIIVNYNYILT